MDILRAASGIKYLAYPSPPSKLRALEYGLSKARGDILLLTDADCRVSPHWVEHMAGSVDTNNTVVIGTSTLSGGSLFDRLQRLDMQISQITYGGMAEAGIATTGQGRSLGFFKKHYLATGGLRRMTECAGDDMFLVLSIAKLQGRAVLCPTCPVLHPPERTLGAFIQQRIRWCNAAKINFHRLSWKAQCILLHIVLVYGRVFWDMLVRKSPWSYLFKFAIDTALLRSGRHAFPVEWKIWPLLHILQHVYFPVAVVGGLFNLENWPKRDDNIAMRSDSPLSIVRFILIWLHRGVPSCHYK